jgi:hypothetical protein
MFQPVSQLAGLYGLKAGEGKPATEERQQRTRDRISITGEPSSRYLDLAGGAHTERLPHMDHSSVLI